MDIHKNARLPPRSRAGWVRRVGGREGRARRPWASGWRAGGPRERRGSRTALAAASPAQARRPTRSPSGSLRCGGSAGPAADRRRRGRRLAGERRRPHPAAARLDGLAALEPAEPVRRNERERPVKLIHIDIETLRRFERIGHLITGRRGDATSRGGWEFVHVLSTTPRGSPCAGEIRLRAALRDSAKVPRFGWRGVDVC